MPLTNKGLWPLRAPAWSITTAVTYHGICADPTTMCDSPAAKKSKPISSGSPFKCCANYKCTLLKRVFYTNSCIVYVGRACSYTQMLTKLPISGSSYSIEAGRTNEKLNIPSNQLDKYSGFASLYF